jgi:hypothetical protein
MKSVMRSIRGIFNPSLEESNKRKQRREFYRSWDKARAGAIGPNDRLEIDAIFERHAKQQNI